MKRLLESNGGDEKDVHVWFAQTRVVGGKDIGIISVYKKKALNIIARTWVKSHVALHGTEQSIPIKKWKALKKMENYHLQKDWNTDDDCMAVVSDRETIEDNALGEYHNKAELSSPIFKMDGENDGENYAENDRENDGENEGEDDRDY